MGPISDTWKVFRGLLLIIPVFWCISLISASFVQIEMILLSLEWGILLHTPFAEEKGNIHPAPLHIQVRACACQGAPPELRMEASGKWSCIHARCTIWAGPDSSKLFWCSAINQGRTLPVQRFSLPRGTIAELENNRTWTPKDDKFGSWPCTDQSQESPHEIAAKGRNFWYITFPAGSPQSKGNFCAFTEE